MIEAAKLEADIYPAGPRGLSAYEIYKKEGGQLSEEEWLKSLNGLTPTIGENGNWFLGTVDTGLPSRGPKGDTGSIKFIVATELPTENIDETAIYLKPVESPTGENNFEELIYVNGKWEDLGTPNVAVDLSNYYTKEESNEKLLAKQDKLIPGNAIEITDDNTLNVIGNTIQILTDEVVALADLNPGVYHCPNMTSFKYGLGGVSAPAMKGRLLLVSINNNNKQAMMFTQNQLQLFDLNRSSSSYYLEQFITKNNTTAYTPTSDYNPATKKYVDDQFTTVNNRTLYLEGTGLIFGDGLNTAENKQLLTDTINKNIGSYFNVIVRDSDSVLTWTYSFDTLPQTTSSHIITLTPYYTMTVAKTTVYIGEMQINYTYDADKGLYNITQWAIVKRRQLSITDQNEYISGTKTFTTLPKTTLVPTTDDQFVNKKYVDDQVGNINTILATLTTVSEVSK